MPVKSSTGLKGVSLHRASGKLQAIYFRAGITYLCGYFNEAKEAADYREKFIHTLEANWIAYLSLVSKSCVQSFVRYIIDNPELFDSADAQAIHNTKIRIIKEFDTPEDVRKTELERQRIRRGKIQANHAKT